MGRQEMRGEGERREEGRLGLGWPVRTCVLRRRKRRTEAGNECNKNEERGAWGRSSGREKYVRKI